MVFLRDTITSFLAHRRARRLSSETLRLYERQLADWQRWREAAGCGPALADVTIDELRRYIAYLSDERPNRDGAPGLAAHSVHTAYRILRALWHYLEVEEDDGGAALLRPPQTRFFKNNRIALPQLPKTERPAVTAGQVAQLLACIAGDDEEGSRDRAIILLLFESGLRVHELCSLTDGCVRLNARRARIVGKGGKEAAVFWGPKAAAALRRYLRYRRGRAGGDLPLLRGCSSRNNGGPITPNLVRSMLGRRAEAAGVELPEGASVHGFRHGFARDMRAKGASIEQVQDQLRHADRTTTLHYLGLDEEPRAATHRRFYDEGDADAENKKRQAR